MKRTNAEFLDDIEWHLQDVQAFSVGHAPGCEDCAEDEDAIATEFSQASCDSCGTHEAGTRFKAHGYIAGDFHHLEVCQDCAMWHANGELPEES